MSGDLAPKLIGPYRILEVLGEGGMGTVYLAEQHAPVERRVALKLIKLGMDTKAVVARFEQEQQALALMQHDGIAKVFECGTSERGQPYFVMEYVKGVPLVQYCDQNRLDLPQRLQLMRQVCAAVQHAHQKGVVHRDLKPGNVLVADEGGKPQPKIIDFGLAKALGRKLIEKSLFTEAGQVIGTPEYMAPEQAEPTNADIDTRADIYSLGVMLYEVLVGQLPFTQQELRNAGLIGMQRLLREVEPPKPSTRLSSLGAGSSATAAARRMSLGALQRALKNDLDWVVLKAIEKDRNRRYDTAAGLAADLQRFLDHEPLVAGPPSAGYRLRKLVRRYRGQVIASAAVLLVMIAGTITSWLLYADAREQERIANGATVLEKKARADAQAHLDRFNLLADVVNLRELKAAEAALYPAFPELVPAMESWLGKARALLGRSGKVQGARDEVLAQSLPLLPASSRATSTASSSSQPTASQVAVRLPEEHPDRFLLETLDKLANDLEAFAQGEVRSVERRCLEAKEIGKLSIRDHQAEWDAAIEAIAQEPKYGGLRLRPQFGLVPIGVDRDSRLWEFAHLPSGKIAKRHPRTGKLAVKDETGIVFVLLPATSAANRFWMGAQKEGQNADPQATPDEFPVKEVKLSAFFLGKHELTQGQWLRLTSAENPSYYSPNHSSNYTLAHPVEQVDWLDCNTWLTRHGLCLPTEAQWEYGCRAGTTWPWWSGEDRESLRTPRIVANLADQAAKRAGALWQSIADWPDLDDGHVGHAPVGSFAPNSFGLHDVHGNVSEWCRDWLLPYSAPTNPGDGLRLGGPSGNRVLRGGCFGDHARRVRSAIRYFDTPTIRPNYVGVRASRVIMQ